MLNEGDRVHLDDLILQDPSTKANHFLFQHALDNDELGIVQYLDTQKSTPGQDLYWVKYSFFTIRIDSKYLVKEG
ncbi:hypothetical protein V9K67_21305 [Paraflavisolibacter sp. H34]|uniref:hypothetical protein n=1 Tax=Huijunlia imazamoxiresistens TaxID=3127457 RepID=UPI0030189111